MTVAIPPHFTRLLHQAEAPAPAGPAEADDTFDEAANRRQNIAWYAADRERREQQRAINNAICDIQHMTEDQQRYWLAHDNQVGLPPALFRKLHPQIRLELIRREEAEILCAAAVNHSEKRLRRVADVESFLRQALPQGQGRPAAAVMNDARAAGIRRRTLYRAKARLHIRSQRHGFGAAGHFIWHWPADAA